MRRVTSESVYLAYPSKGNIVLSREEFSAIFTGNVLVISGSLNQTSEQANSSAQNLTTEEVPPQQLTAETMQTIQGRAIIKAVIIAKIVSILKTAVKIAKGAWRSGIRHGRALRNRVRDAILRRVPFAGHRRVQNAARGAAAAVIPYIVYAIPRNKFCWGTAISHGKGGAIVGFLWG